MKLKLKLEGPGEPRIAPEFKGDAVYMSGSTMLAYTPGQDLSKSTVELLKETEHYLPSKRRKRASSVRDGKSKGTKQVGGGSGNRSSVSLLDLIEKGFLEPGEEILSCSYQGISDTATLTERGTILWEDEEFSNPTAWSIKFKRLHNPAKVADDGWKSVVFNNENVLAHYRAEYLDDPQGAGMLNTRSRRRR